MNSLSLKTTSRTCLFCEGQVSAAAMFDETTFNLSQNETPRCTPLRKTAHQVGKCHAEHAECWEGLSWYLWIPSDIICCEKNTKHVLNDRRKAFLSNRQTKNQRCAKSSSHKKIKVEIISDAPRVCYNPHTSLYAKVKHSQNEQSFRKSCTSTSWWLDLQCWKGKNGCFHLPKRFLRQLERRFNWVRTMAQCFSCNTSLMLVWCQLQMDLGASVWMPWRKCFLENTETTKRHPTIAMRVFFVQ